MLWNKETKTVSSIDSPKQSHEIDFKRIEASYQYIREVWPEAKPEVGLIFGSGLGEVATLFNTKDSIPYSDIVGLGESGVSGHKSQLSWAELNGKEAFLFEGRRHYYEGEGWTPLVLPAHVLSKFGATSFIATNAAGSINPELHPGDLMLVNNHINLLGTNPILGIRDYRESDGDSLYDPALRNQLKESAKRANIKLPSGILAAVSGPMYETAAEIQLLKGLEADATGMSVVPSSIASKGLNLDMAAISCITNYGTGLSNSGTSHDDVVEASKLAIPKLKSIIENYLSA